MLLAPFLYILSASLCALVSLLMFASYQRSKNSILKDLSVIFLFLALHAYILTLPIVFKPENLTYLSYVYSIGIALVYGLLLLSLRVQAFLNRKFFRIYGNLIRVVTALVGTIVLSIQLFEHRLPTITEQGVILWGVNPWASWMTGIISLCYGLGWSYLFYRASFLVKNPYSKIKMLVLSLNGLLLGVAAILIFTSTTELQTLVGVTFFLVCCVISIPITFLPKESAKSAN